MRLSFVLIFLLYFSCMAYAQALYEVSSGIIDFHSDAPQELIKASSDELHGYIDIRKKIFAFKLNINSFMGFNSPLQREHFNENYMESTHYPEAIYSGKIIEDVDLSKEGGYNVRAKGKLNIHGIDQERIINAVISIKNGRMVVKSAFVISLADHNIKIPRVVYEKLAPDIKVTVNALLVPKS